MKILLKIKILIGLFILLNGAYAKAQTNGFIGSKNAISVDVSSMLQREIKLQYYGHLKKHQQLIVNFTRQNINDGVLIYQEGDQLHIDLHHINNSIGIGFVRNNKKLKMPMPIGFYCGLSYQRHWGKLNQNLDGVLLDTYHHRSNLSLLILGRGIAISPQLFVNISVNTGVKFGKYFLVDDAQFDIPPLVMYPQNIPFVKSDTKKLKQQANHYSYRSFYAMPSIKFGILF